jgi:peptidylprolyl isomerase
VERDEGGDAAILDLIAWETGPEGAPLLVFAPPRGLSGPAVRVVEPGDGTEVREGDAVTFDYAMFAGDTGEQAFSTYETGSPQTIALFPATMSQTFAAGLIGQRTGARLIFGTIDTSGNTAADYLVTMFMAVTIEETRPIPPRASGEPVAPPPGLPSVTDAVDGTPSVAIPAGDPPSELVHQVLIAGTGAKLTEGQTVILHLAGWVWTDGTLFDSTWVSGGPRPMDLATGSTLPGLIYGLVGQRVGSRVLLVVPPSLALGDNATDAIPAGSTLVYVVDILDAS